MLGVFPIEKQHCMTGSVYDDDIDLLFLPQDPPGVLPRPADSAPQTVRTMTCSS